MILAKIWGAALIIISFYGWTKQTDATRVRPRLPLYMTTFQMALAISVLYVFPAIGLLLLTVVA
jgi:hypothetical protein